MDELEKAIKRTVEYGERFGVAYTEEEVRERLISRKVYKKLLITNYKLLIKKEKDKNYLIKLSEAKKLAEEIGKTFPSILFIGVTGSVAAGYPKKNSDIDLMLITKKDSLWLTRLVLRIWVWWNGVPHRRYGAMENKNEFCFNLWLEEDVLKLPKNKQNLRNAMDTILMKPILNKNNIYEKFLRKNRWVGRWVANGYATKIKEQTHPSGVRRSEPPSSLGAISSTLDKEGRAHGRLLVWLNYLVFWPQWWYMRRKIGGGLVDRKRAFFHPRNNGV